MSYRPASVALQAGWLGGAAMTVVLPLMLLGVSRVQHHQTGGDESANSSNSSEGEGQQQQQQTYSTDDVTTRNDIEASVPWWYFNGSSRSRNDDEEDTESSSSTTSPPTTILLLAAYVWSLLIFMSIVYSGHLALRKNTNTEGILLALLVFAGYNLICLFVLGGSYSKDTGAVKTQGPDVEEYGFMGQLGVMFYLTSLFWLLFSVLFAVWLRRRARRSAVTKVTVDSADYRIHNDDEDDDNEEDDECEDETRMDRRY